MLQLENTSYNSGADVFQLVTVYNGVIRHSLLHWVSLGEQ